MHTKNDFNFILIIMSFVKINCFAVAIISAFEISQIACGEFKVIETSDGAVRGVNHTTWWKKVDYYSFKGIPYAEKPIGKLRFKVIIRSTQLKPSEFLFINLT